MLHLLVYKCYLFCIWKFSNIPNRDTSKCDMAIDLNCYIEHNERKIILNGHRIKELWRLTVKSFFIFFTDKPISDLKSVTSCLQIRSAICIWINLITKNTIKKSSPKKLCLKELRMFKFRKKTTFSHAAFAKIHIDSHKWHRFSQMVACKNHCYFGHFPFFSYSWKNL